MAWFVGFGRQTEIDGVVSVFISWMWLVSWYGLGTLSSTLNLLKFFIDGWGLMHEVVEFADQITQELSTKFDNAWGLMPHLVFCLVDLSFCGSVFLILFFNEWICTLKHSINKLKKKIFRLSIIYVIGKLGF